MNKIFKLSTILVLFLLTISSICAYSIIEVKTITPWDIESLPCRELKYELEISNIDKNVNKYHLSVPKYENYVEFSENDFVIEPEKLRRIAVYVKLPCSVSGEINLDLYIQKDEQDGAIKVPLRANIKSDYTREISVMPVSVCRGETGTGSLHILNPSTTPNLFLVTGSLPRWFDLKGNKALLPGNSQADFNFTISQNSKIGEHLVGLTVKDFSGTEEIPVTINIQDCENNFELLDTKILAVVGLEESFKIPFTGLKDSMSLAIQAPEWITMEQNYSDNFLTLNINPLEIESGDYEVNVLAQNGKTVSEKLTVTVTTSKILKFIRTYFLNLIILLIILLLGVGYCVFNKRKPFNKINIIQNLKDLKNKINFSKISALKLNKDLSFDNFDLTNFELQNKVKILTEFKVDVVTSSRKWVKILGYILGAILILSGIVYVIWRYFWAWMIEKVMFLVPVKQKIVSALLSMTIYWEYIAIGSAVIILVILFDKFRNNGIDIKKFKMDNTKLKSRAKGMIILAVVVSIGYVIWKYGANLVKNTMFLMPVYKFLISLILSILAYWQYILCGCAIVISVILFDKLKTKGYFEKLYSYLFDEPDNEVDEKVYEIKSKE